MKIKESIELRNTKHGHSKQYFAELFQDGKKWFLVARWGKIGGNLNKNKRGPFDEAKAYKEFRALVAAKKSDGYEDPHAQPEQQGIPTFYPMKADDATPVVVEACLDDPRMIAEEKFDGSRYLLKFDGKEFHLHSRRVSVKDNKPVDKTANIPHIIEEVRQLKRLMAYGSFVLDGEIMWDHGNVISIMGAKRDKALARQEEIGPVYFVVYDLPYCEGVELFDMPLFQRRLMLEHGLSPDGKHVRLSKQVTKDKKKFLQEVWARGGEGIILKDPDGMYEPGNRPKGNWIKVKRLMADEFVVMGFKPGDESGKYSDQVGSIVFGQYNKKGQLVPISFCSGFTDAERLAMTKNPKKYIGQVLEVKFNEITRGDALTRIQRLVKVLKIDFKGEIPYSLRHPRFLRWREDGNPKECVLKEE